MKGDCLLVRAVRCGIWRSGVTRVVSRGNVMSNHVRAAAYIPLTRLYLLHARYSVRGCGVRRAPASLCHERQSAGGLPPRSRLFAIRPHSSGMPGLAPAVGGKYPAACFRVSISVILQENACRTGRYNADAGALDRVASWQGTGLGYPRRECTGIMLDGVDRPADSTKCLGRRGSCRLTSRRGSRRC